MKTHVANRPSLRTHFRTLRQQLDAATRAAKTQRLNQHLSALEVLQQCQRLAAYLASSEEVSVEPSIEAAWQRGQDIFLPCIDPEPRTMTFRHYQHDTPLIKNRFGLLQPESATKSVSADNLDCALVPLVAFDNEGSRLGMGGGYYDTFFAQAQNRPLLVGVGFSEQQATELLPKARWDVMLDMAVTDLGVTPFTESGSLWLSEK